ncbi:hypothetical protein HDU93_002848 [Gonapodya sp. JEL0774]|nr:hypothetical protein HDU93_002848 [Gonapodya sp. JEL0774]
MAGVKTVEPGGLFGQTENLPIPNNVLKPQGTDYLYRTRVWDMPQSPGDAKSAARVEDRADFSAEVTAMVARFRTIRVASTLE